MKVCTKCHQEKDESQFHKDRTKKDGLHSWCNKCISIAGHIWRSKNREHIKKWGQQYAKTEKGKEVNKRAMDKYIKSGKCKQKQSIRIQNELEFKIKVNLRSYIYHIIKNNKKSDHTINLLGCMFGEFIKHLESQFTEGMTWENYGRGKNKWNLDHIIPCDFFDLTDSYYQKVCFHYLNIQPMWQDINVKKSNKVPEYHKELLEIIINEIELKNVE
jgi:hypothetical protein